VTLSLLFAAILTARHLEAQARIPTIETRIIRGNYSCSLQAILWQATKLPRVRMFSMARMSSLLLARNL
jgi:hypothetical protein